MVVAQGGDEICIVLKVQVLSNSDQDGYCCFYLA